MFWFELIPKYYDGKSAGGRKFIYTNILQTS
jgi:hypothetical protein